jgi:hypothetical protein
MDVLVRGVTDQPPRTGIRVPSPLAWQRTDTVGTEIVLDAGLADGAVEGAAVVAGMRRTPRTGPPALMPTVPYAS